MVGGIVILLPFREGSVRWMYTDEDLLVEIPYYYADLLRKESAKWGIHVDFHLSAVLLQKLMVAELLLSLSLSMPR